MIKCPKCGHIIEENSQKLKPKPFDVDRYIEALNYDGDICEKRLLED